MANNVVVPVQVEKLTKFGYKDAQGFVSYSKNMTDADKALVVPGASFEAEIYTAESGARYLNKIVARAAHVSAPKAVEVPKAAVKGDSRAGVATLEKVTKSFSSEMTRADWDAKDRRISRQGCIQAAVQAVASFSTEETIFENAVELASQMLDFVNK